MLPPMDTWPDRIAILEARHRREVVALGLAMSALGAAAPVPPNWTTLGRANRVEMLTAFVTAAAGVVLKKLR